MKSHSTSYDQSVPSPPQLRLIPGQRPALRTMLLEPGFPYGEDLLQFIWETRLFEQHALRTIDGRPVEVLKPGRIQPNSGPDLSDAQIRIDGQLWAGTVEVHLRSSEWNAHGHQYDPAYENVVLHVVYEHDAEVRTLTGKTLPTVELLSRISTDSIAMHHALMTSRGSVPCAAMLPTVDPFRIGQWLERLLVERLQRKTMAVGELYRRLNNDASATFYHMLMQAFGMKVNAEPFGMLANVLPLRTLLKYRDDELRTEALLFGQAGLLQVDMVDEHPRRLQQEHALLTSMHGLRTAPLAAWKLGRIRPVNLPTIRLAQFVRLFTKLDGELDRLLQEEEIGRLHDLLDVEAGGYWITHYQFDRPTTSSRKRIGRMAMDHIIINAIVPTLFALGRLQGREAMVDRALQLTEQLPSESNQILQDWAALGIKSDTAGRGQALLELKTMYCTRRSCLTCGIGSEIFKRTAPGTSPDHGAAGETMVREAGLRRV
jgi:hypothetical protein